MYGRLIAALVVVVFLAGTHWKAYKVGGRAVETRYQTQALAAEQKIRELEQNLMAQKQKAEEAYVEQKRKAAAAAASAQSELGRLRDALAQRGQTPADPASSPGVDDRAGLEQELLGQCASALVSMAAEADRLEAIVIGLQGYVKGVCLAR